jgi:hypothetical protein
MANPRKSIMKPGTLCLAAGLLFFSACGEADSSQIVPSDGSFDVVTLVSSGGMPGPRHDGDECDSMYNETITVARATATVTWDTCWYGSAAGHSIIDQGTRSLTTDELASVSDALLEMTIGNDGLCGFDKPTVTLDVVRNGTVGRYVDDFYGCQPPPDGRIFVEKMDWVESAMWKLIP